jgi:magnesium-transporting ATPase (P-type)
MSLVVFVTSENRLKFDVHAKERNTSNCIVDNSYINTRSDHTKLLSRGQVIRQGPSASRHGKGRKGSTFPFGISASFRTSHPANDNNGAVVEATTATKNPEETPEIAEATLNTDSTGPTGESPDSAFLRRALGGGILCSKCVLGDGGGRQGEIGNPTELSILRAAYFGNVNVSEVKDSAPIVAEVPFNSEYKFMATVHEPNAENDGPEFMDNLVVHVKGAPDRLIPLCQYQARNGNIAEVEPVDKNYWIDQIAILSSHGLRVLALARATAPKGSIKAGDQLGPEFVNGRDQPWLTIVGLCAIMDPPRPECIRAVKEAHTAGVRVAMITGDHKDTALAIGATLGIADADHPEAITGPELDNMSEEELRVAVMKYNVFARASPQNKIMIVKALQAEGQTCGMTGDGVNDAPALKAADMGVAMGLEGTDVAREASDMILADDNFATIIAAVREGRVVWDDLRKVLLVNTPINNAQGMSVLFGLLFGLDQSPLSSIQVLYSNLICACTLGFVCAVEPAEEGIMEQPPRRVGKRLIGRFLLLRILLGTAIMVICVVGAVFWARSKDYDLNEERAQALNVLNFTAISVTMSARFARKSAFHPRSFYGNPLANWSYAIMICLQAFITYTPGLNTTLFSQTGMDAWQWGLVALAMVIVFVVMESEKALRNILADRKYDVDDLEYGPFDAPPTDHEMNLPPEVKRFGHNEIQK